MFPETVFEASLDRFAEEFRGREVPDPAPLSTDSWLARSVLQKAIRRGMVDLALSAAAQLVIIDRRTLWRRLLVTALEDLGLQEFGTIAAIVCAARNARWRSQIGGDWPVIATLVHRACAGTRNQAANDLWNIALHDPALADVKADLCEMSPEAVRTLSMQAPDFGVRAAAALVAMGQAEWCDSATYDHRAFFHEHAACAPDQSAILSEAFRMTRVPLAGLLLTLAHEPVQSVARVDDDIAPSAWNGPIPTFAMDQYTRSGKAMIRQFSQQSLEWNAFCDAWNIPRSNRTAAAGELLFRIDGAVVTSRAVTAQSAAIRQRSEALGCFVPSAAVYEAFSILRRQLMHIDQMRLGLKLT